MAVRVTSPALRTAMRSIQRDVDEETDRARSWIGFSSANVLRSDTPRSPFTKGWYDTGRQRAGYVFAIEGNRVAIGNTARSRRGYSYPRLNERRYQVAGRQLRRRRSQVVRLAQRSLDAGLSEYRGPLRRRRLTSR